MTFYVQVKRCCLSTANHQAIIHNNWLAAHAARRAAKTTESEREARLQQSYKEGTDGHL